MSYVILLFQEGARAAVRPPAEVGVEGNVVNAVLWLKLAVEAALQEVI